MAYGRTPVSPVSCSVLAMEILQFCTKPSNYNCVSFMKLVTSQHTISCSFWWLISWMKTFQIQIQNILYCFLLHKRARNMNIWHIQPRFLFRCSQTNGRSNHYDDVIMGAIASQITSLTIIFSTVYSGADQSKHQSTASLAFVWGIHRGPVNSPHKWPVTRKMFPFDDVIMHIM